ncbi:MAG: hypothetical protein ACT4O2_14160 [Beijerinckiaceae bacterium]
MGPSGNARHEIAKAKDSGAVASSNADAAAALGPPVLDAPSPLVSKGHSQGERYVQQGRLVAVTADARHPEQAGQWVRSRRGPSRPIRRRWVNLGLAPHAPIAYVSQMALSVGETKSIIAALPSVANDLSCKLPAAIND